MKLKSGRLPGDVSLRLSLGIAAMLTCLMATSRQSLAVEDNKGNVGQHANIAASALPSLPEMVVIPGKNYEIGKYDVTQGEWKAVMGNNPSNFKSCGDSCPVEQVSWDDAQEFIQKLNSMSGKEYRLPTEAEWEYACYGSGKTEYCGGNDIDSIAWYGSNSHSATHSVGQKYANSFGLFDMSGNVWQWTQGKYDNGHDWLVLRGGSWLDGAQDVRAANRDKNKPAYRDFSVGFRLARTL